MNKLDKFFVKNMRTLAAIAMSLGLGFGTHMYTNQIISDTNPLKMLNKLEKLSENGKFNFGLTSLTFEPSENLNVEIDPITKNTQYENSKGEILFYRDNHTGRYYFIPKEK